MKSSKRVLVLLAFAIGCLVLAISIGGVIMDKTIDYISASILIASVLAIYLTGRVLFKEKITEKKPSKPEVFTYTNGVVMASCGLLTLLFLVDAILANPYSFFWVIVFLIGFVSMINKLKRIRRTNNDKKN